MSMLNVMALKLNTYMLSGILLFNVKFMKMKKTVHFLAFVSTGAFDERAGLTPTCKDIFKQNSQNW